MQALMGYPPRAKWLAELLQQMSDDQQDAGSLENAALLAIARKLAYKNQLHSILTRINEAIVRVREPQALYAEACRIATSADLFRMAWVGLVDPEAGVLKPVAWAGAEDGYLASIRISVGDDPEGQGPSGSAIRKGRHFICEDFETDQRMGPWRAEALRRGYRSSAAFPLMLDGKVFGAFTLYGSLPRFFDAPRWTCWPPWRPISPSPSNRPRSSADAGRPKNACGRLTTSWKCV